MNNSLVWILGQGGFLGSALVDEHIRRGDTVFAADSISWSLPSARLDDFRRNWDHFLQHSHDGNRKIIWAAGTSGVSVESSPIDNELACFKDLVTTIRNHEHSGNMQFYLCSSAGGAYAGSVEPPFTSSTIAIPQSHYGEMKLLIEELATGPLAANMPVTVGRISNLYGPWNGARQGLINRLCRAGLDRNPLNLYVPMGTVRDYLYISDAAQLIAESTPSIGVISRIEVIASGINTTIAQAISTVSSVAHRKIPVSIGSDDNSTVQPEDLRLIPSWTNTNPQFTPIDLATGSRHVLTYLSTRPRLPLAI